MKKQWVTMSQVWEVENINKNTNMNYTEKQILKHLREKNNARLQRHSEFKSSVRRNKLKSTAKQITGLLWIFMILTIIANSMTWDIELEVPKQAHAEVLDKETIEYVERQISSHIWAPIDEVGFHINKVKERYDTTFTDSINFIADFEGFRENAYWDVKRYSIWFWTPSYKNEKITREEALERKKEFVKPMFELVDKDCFTPNQKIALTSYMYNAWAYPMNLQTYIKRCDKKSIVYIMSSYGWSANWIRHSGLAKRRKLEISKFNQY